MATKKSLCYSFLLMISFIIFQIHVIFADENKGFNIFLVKNEKSIFNQEIPKNIKLKKPPILTIDDIIEFNWGSQTMKVSLEKKKLFENKYNSNFAVVVDNEIIYCGKIWSPVSSVAVFGPVIFDFEIGNTHLPDNIIIHGRYPDDIENFYKKVNVRIKIQMNGYQKEIDFMDYRFDPRIKECLMKFGKIKNFE